MLADRAIKPPQRPLHLVLSSLQQAAQTGRRRRPQPFMQYSTALQGVGMVQTVQLTHAPTCRSGWQSQAQGSPALMRLLPMSGGSQQPSQNGRVQNVQLMHLQYPPGKANRRILQLQRAGMTRL